CSSNYTLIRTWTATDACGNIATDSQTITIQDTTAPTLVTPLSSVLNVICSDIPIIPQLEFIDNCSTTVTISFDEEITTISSNEYIIIREWLVSDLCGNSDLFTQTINVTNNPIIIRIPFDICTDDIATDLFLLLDTTIPTNGEWIDVSNSGGLNNSIFDPMNLSLGNYIIQYLVTETNSNCPSVYEIIINLNDDCVVLPACEITIYNAVSPNNDNLNDFFFVDGIECYTNNSIEIYNRWGILVFETNNYNNENNAFKGYSHGRTTITQNEKLPNGTYFYVLKYIDAENNTNDKTGYLYLNQ
ncbi:gliding motility-associated C-terminal domain-containing protein, partial [Flavobacterium jejuense]